MFRRSLLALAVAALLLPSAAAVRAQTVDEILAKHFEAQGGVEKLKKVQSWRLTGKMGIGPGMEAPFTMEKKRPALQRLEFTFSGMTGIQVFDGKGGWQVMPFMGKKDPEPMSAEDAKQMEDQADFDGPLMDWKAKGHTIELAGKESIEGADAYKLKITKKSGQVEYYYLDTETYLTVKEEAKRSMHGTEVEGESYMSDYKEVDGLMVPFSVTNGAKGSDRKQVMTFEKIEVNVPLDDARFVMPAATTAADSSKAGAAKDAAKDAKDAKAAVKKDK